MALVNHGMLTFPFFMSHLFLFIKESVGFFWTFFLLFLVMMVMGSNACSGLRAERSMAVQENFEPVLEECGGVYSDVPFISL